MQRIAQALLVALLGVLASRAVFADLPPAYGQCRESGEVCDGFAEGNRWVGLCQGGRCESRVPIATIREVSATRPYRSWTPHAIGALAIALVCAGCWLVDRWLCRRKERAAAILEQTLPARSRARRALGWAIPLAVLVAAYVAIFRSSLALAWSARCWWSKPPITSPAEGQGSISTHPDDPRMVETSSGAVLVAAIEMRERGGNLVVAFDVASQVALWWRAPKEWLEDPLRFTVHDGKVIIFDGAGGVEIRDPRSGAVERTVRLEYRVQEVEGIAGEPVVAVWDVRGPHNGLNLRTGEFAMRVSRYGGRHVPCGGGADQKWSAALDGESIRYACEAKGGLLAVVQGKTKIFELVAIDARQKLIWRQRVKPPVYSFGEIIRLAAASDVALMLDDCIDKKCRVVARDLATGERRWDFAADDDVTLNDSHGTADLVLILRRDGRWSGGEIPTSRYDVFRAKSGEIAGTIPAR